MVVAARRLLRLIRKAAIRDELLAMRLRSELVVTPVGTPEVSRPEDRSPRRISGGARSRPRPDGRP